MPRRRASVTPPTLARAAAPWQPAQPAISEARAPHGAARLRRRRLTCPAYTVGMLSYTHGVGTAPLLGDTIGRALGRTVARFGDRAALVVRSQRYRATWRQLDVQSASLARGLLSHDV